MRNFKKPLLFSAAMLPVIIPAVVLTAFYQMQLYPSDIIASAINQLGSKTALIILSAVQGSLLVAACCFFGYILADKTGLWIPLYIEKDKLFKTFALSVSAGLVFSLDYWTFGAYEPLIQSSITGPGLSAAGFGAAVLYGGIAEEILMRLFLMSLISFILWKLFCRSTPKNKLPNIIFIAANIISTLLFAAGHLPATVTAFGALTPMLLARCFLLNGIFGLLFGRLYRRYGIWYSMAAHMLVHIVSKAVWLILI